MQRCTGSCNLAVLSLGLTAVPHVLFAHHRILPFVVKKTPIYEVVLYVKTMGRECIQCHSFKSVDEYTTSQWSRGDGISRCRRCVEGYYCATCSKQFARPKALELHIRKRHPIHKPATSLPSNPPPYESLMTKKFTSADLIWLFRKAPK